VKTSGFAFHSPYVEAAGPFLRKKLNSVMAAEKERSSKWITTSRGSSICSADYLVNNLISPVYFAEALEQVPENALVVELSPTTLLQAVLRRGLHSSVGRVALTKRTAGNPLLHFVQSLGSLYLNGLNLDFTKLYAPVQFPVSLATPNIHNLIKWDHDFSWNFPSYEKVRL